MLGIKDVRYLGMLSKLLLILKNCTDILEIMHNQISLVDEDSKIPVLRIYTIN